ncbi:MAG: hypothetical protein NUW01_12510 [Gemmatimonadaceae bacterium]|nr:hypothetical protein [Gemmatimonadaceae bacterium]
MKRTRPFAVALVVACSLAAGAIEDRQAQVPRPAGGQSAYDTLKTPLKARVVDRRFYTKEAMYLANEMNQSGEPFLNRAEALGLPVSDDTDFQYMTSVESYWYSRYNMQVLLAESRLGVALVHGPYLTEKALEIANSQYNRDRGENELSGKDVLLQHLVPQYLARTGFPRRFEDASPIMIEYASGDPHFTRRVDNSQSFETSENLWKERKFKQLYGSAYTEPTHEAGEGGNDFFRYRVAYRDTFESLRWANDRMDRTIDMGAVGQALMKAVLWSEYFFRQTHHDGYLGNNPEEGFRGAILNLSSISKLLLLKSALVFDGKRLTGINPFDYDPNRGLHYFPHRTAVTTRYIGDLPPRLEDLKVSDRGSELFDQASLLWGLGEYFYFMDPKRTGGDEYLRTGFGSWNKVFGDNPPYDGSIFERKYMQLARGLATLVLKNIDFMHKDQASGILISRWVPQGQSAREIAVADLGMTIVALANFAHHFAGAEPELAARASTLLKTQADFLVARQAPDGGFPNRFALAANAPADNERALLAQAFAVRGLLAAYEQTRDVRYVEAAKRTYAFMNDALWSPEQGLYRSGRGAETTVYTPLNLGAALGAMREMILLTRSPGELQRYKRFWVQAVNASGIQQSEYEETGDDKLGVADSDRDGIPRLDFGDGKYGIAPVYAGRVEIDTPLPAARVTRR